ncbi:uncharacterized protein EI97DRAFT_436746 [Westerdykella ornata]|uniref:Glc8 protein n=1 Tax=Westerdykella ornata TaxID=318751 RepID=A0A6A6JBU5_WESOR|nr:uncharacterized protein EI97DRAFT_436746 [Westerdykella ornata]KAF2272659.1 hypothetical protein EI97DRAFT_436746 [Westerdykella ornata]
MTQHATVLHSPPHHSERPKGILKNSSTYRSNTVTSPTGETFAQRPDLNRDKSEKEIVLENTLKNAGLHRRSSSNPRGVNSRRQSGTNVHADDSSPRLKWDEANLYLTEQQRDSTMKITEPKTPYAKQYDPAEDEAEMEMLDAENIQVDELDHKKPARKPRIDDIPDFDLGEPELEAKPHHSPESEKRVIVDEHAAGEEDVGHHGEEWANMTPEEQEKHRKFEEMRRKHYEMKNVKNLLGHPENLDDEDDDSQEVPPMPNGQ